MWRLARPADDPAIVRMFLALNAEDPGDVPVGPQQVAHTLAVLRAEPMRGRAVVAEVDSQVVGYALLIAFWSNERGGEVCILDELYLVPGQRGRGLGQMLIDSLRDSDTFLPGPAVAIGLEVSPGNAKARRFFQRCGFVGGNTAMHLARRLSP